MDFFDLIALRRSIRTFEVTPVEQDTLNKILTATNLAPSAGNLQAYEVYVVSKKQIREALAEAAVGQEFIAVAPVVLVFCAHPQRAAEKYSERGEQLYALQDATIACTYAMLAATRLGLGCVWVGAFHEDKVRQALNLGDDLRPVAILPLGTAAETPAPRSRREFESLFHLR